MNSLIALLSFALLVYLGQEAVTLHKLTVCRQEAWRSSVTLHTRALLSRPETSEKEVLHRCGILVSRDRKSVTWQRSLRQHSVPLRLKGTL